MKKKGQRLLGILLAVMLLAAAPMTALAAWANPFTDVKPGAWYYKAVEYVNTEGLFNGTAPDKFSPESPMTRGMFVTVLGKFAGVNTADYKTNTFTDVSSGAYYAPYVSWASEKGVVNGVSPTRFAPNDPITREQMATMLYKYARAFGCDTQATPEKLLDFPDGLKTSQYAQQAMAWAVTHGVLAGSDGKLLPQGTATRAQTAQIFYNAHELLETQVEEPQLEKVWVVDEPGHYEVTYQLELVPITVGEVGHWEDVFYTHWVYRCNQCGYIAETVEEVNAHQDENFNWDTMIGTCWSYTMVSSEPEYTGEKYWVVDDPGHTEYEWQMVEAEVWVEEVGHWEYR